MVIIFQLKLQACCGTNIHSSVASVWSSATLLDGSDRYAEAHEVQGRRNERLSLKQTAARTFQDSEASRRILRYSKENSWQRAENRERASERQEMLRKNK